MSPKQDKEFSPELRMLLAAVLGMVVIFAWAKLFLPSAPQPPATPPPATANAPAQPGSVPPSTTAPGSTAPAAANAAGGVTASAAAPVKVAPKSETQERTIVVENDLYRVEFSNRGGVVKSWKLKKYLDDAKPQRMLDLVHSDASGQTGGWPFSLALEDAQIESVANSALYQATALEGGAGTPSGPATPDLRAPAELKFEWSDGQTEVTKTFRFGHSYVVRAETSVQQNGRPLTAGLAWRGGFGDLTVVNPIPVEQVNVFYSASGKLNLLPHKNLQPADQVARNAWMGGNAYAGIEDRYFAAVFLPVTEAPPSGLAVRYWKLTRDVQAEGKTVQEPVPEVAIGAGAPGSTSFRVYVGPKNYDDLKRMNPPLQELVQFGSWLQFVAAPLFYLLKWMHQYVPNWGWAIVVLTLAINMLLFPLKVKSYRSMQRMQKVAPEVKQIQARYKKYGMRDPRKAEMNKEVMAVYNREGVNPIGGCLPMVVQMPIWFGLYRMLTVTIELRHAPWILWFHDLSAKDPTYILVIIMAATMYYMQKMTPMTATDPTQQTVMKFMPVMFAGMFVIYPVSSGLVLYILTQNVVGIAQQWYLNRTHPMPTGKPEGGRRK